MKINYTIHQIANIASCPYSFMSWDFAIEHGFNFNNHYEKVWEGEYDTEIFEGKDFYVEDILERLYEIFNLYIHYHEGYEGHSLSTSDIVELKIDNFNLGKYYCDSYGWIRIEDEGK